ncbi:MAG: hypothetical protein MUC69_07080, partial [Gemmatimonadales bacterium]|nr:hypothetical protein [Gemmatimonadales bacterium]
RAFGDEPAAVGRAVAAWVRGCQGAGALACAKHYPGHGRTTLDSHMALPSVDAPRELLERDDLAPFRAAVAAGVASLMTAHVAYPALDPTGAPATLSPTILGMLRRSGFDGLVVSDALIMEGALGGRTEAGAAVAALAAGVDVLLYPEHPRAVAEAVAAAVAEGRLPEERVREALHRVRHAVEVVEAQPATATAEGHTAGAIADALLRLPMARGAAAPLAAPIELLQVDDDLGGPFPPTPSTAVRERLAALGVPMARGGSRVVLVFAEPRAWKGRSGLGEASRAALASASVGAALVVLFGHPRLVAEVPDGPAVLVAWHRQRLMQEAVAQWLADAVRARA